MLNLLLRSILVVLIVLTLFVGALTWLMIDSEPRVKNSALDGLNDAESVHELLQQLQSSVVDRQTPHTIQLTKAQLLSLIAFAERAKPQFQAEIRLASSLSSLNLTYQLPTPFEHSFVNISASLMPGEGVNIGNIRIGDMNVRGDWALRLMTFLVDSWTQSDIGSFAIEQIESVSMDTSKLSIRLLPLDGLLRELNQLQHGLNVDQDGWLSQRTAYYLRHLARFSVENDPVYLNKQPSLGIYLQAVMQHVGETAERSIAEENEAALLALTIFTGHHRFGNLVGSVQVDPDRAVRPPNPTVILGRRDLSQHLIISAGLKLLSEQGITNAIGEFKELMDRVLGGSGYSFVDLAADMAGVRLAEAAIDPDSAHLIQQRLAENAAESTFMPSIGDLPEGLDKQAFVERFGDVDSAAYIQQVELISSRISQLSLYQKTQN